MTDHAKLRHEGYALLRGAIPGEWLPSLRESFDTGVLPS